MMSDSDDNDNDQNKLIRLSPRRLRTRSNSHDSGKAFSFNWSRSSSVFNKSTSSQISDSLTTNDDRIQKQPSVQVSFRPFQRTPFAVTTHYNPRRQTVFSTTVADTDSVTQGDSKYDDSSPSTNSQMVPSGDSLSIQVNIDDAIDEPSTQHVCNKRLLTSVAQQNSIASPNNFTAPTRISTSSGGASSSVKIRSHDSVCRRALRRLRIHRNKITCVAVFTYTGRQPDDLDPDSGHFIPFIVTGSGDHTACVWNSNTGRQRLCLTHGSWISSVAAGKSESDFSTNCSVFIVTAGEDNVAKVWDADAGSILHTLIGHSESITSVALHFVVNENSSNGASGFSILDDDVIIVTGSEDRTVKSWDGRSGSLLGTFSDHTHHITSVALVTVVPEVSNFGSNETISNRTATCCLPFSPSGSSQKPRSMLDRNEVETRTILLTGSKDRTAKLWDISSGVVLKTLNGHKRQILSVAAFFHPSSTPEGPIAVTGSADLTAIVWDGLRGTILFTINELMSSVWSVAIVGSMNGEAPQICLGTADGQVSLWDGTIKRRIVCSYVHDECTTGVALFAHTSAEMPLIVSASYDCSMVIWDSCVRQRISTFHDCHADAVTTVKGFHSIDCNGFSIPIVVTGSEDGSSKVWNVTNGELLRTFVGHAGGVTCIAIMPKSGSCRQPLSTNRSKSDTSNIQSRLDPYIITGSFDGTGRIWDTACGEHIGTLIGHKGGLTTIAVKVNYEDNSSLVVSGSWDHNVIVWNMDTYLPKYTLNAHNSFITTLDFLKPTAIFTSEISPFDRETNTHDEDYNHTFLNSLLITCCSFSMKLWNCSDGTMIKSFDRNHILDDSEYLVADTSHKSNDVGSIDRGSINDIAVFAFNVEGIISLYVATANKDGSARVHDLKGNQSRLVQVLQKKGMYSMNSIAVAASPEMIKHKNTKRSSCLICAGGQEKVFRLWDLVSGQLLRSISDSVGSFIECVSIIEPPLTNCIAESCNSIDSTKLEEMNYENAVPLVFITAKEDGSVVIAQNLLLDDGLTRLEDSVVQPSFHDISEKFLLQFSKKSGSSSTDPTLWHGFLKYFCQSPPANITFSSLLHLAVQYDAADFIEMMLPFARHLALQPFRISNDFTAVIESPMAKSYANNKRISRTKQYYLGAKLKQQQHLARFKSQQSFVKSSTVNSQSFRQLQALSVADDDTLYTGYCTLLGRAAWYESLPCLKVILGTLMEFITLPKTDDDEYDLKSSIRSKKSGDPYNNYPVIKPYVPFHEESNSVRFCNSHHIGDHIIINEICSIAYKFPELFVSTLSKMTLVPNYDYVRGALVRTAFRGHSLVSGSDERSPFAPFYKDQTVMVNIPEMVSSSQSISSSNHIALKKVCTILDYSNDGTYRVMLDDNETVLYGIKVEDIRAIPLPGGSKNSHSFGRDQNQYELLMPFYFFKNFFPTRGLSHSSLHSASVSYSPTINKDASDCSYWVWQSHHSPNRIDKIVQISPWVVPVKDICALDSNFLPTVVYCARRLRSSAIFENEVVRTVVDFKWHAFARRYFMFDFIWSSILSIVFVAHAVVFEFYVRHGHEDSYDINGVIWGTVTISIIMVMVFRFLLHELHQFHLAWQGLYGMSVKYYLTDGWNIMQISTIVMILLSTIAHFVALIQSLDTRKKEFMNPETENTISAMTMPFLAANVLFYLQGLESSGFLVRMILKVFQGTIIFTLILLIILVAFSASFMLLYTPLDLNLETEGAHEFAGALLTIYGLLLQQYSLGDFSRPQSPAVATLLLCVFIFVNMVIMLNLLIAIMEDIYDKTQENAAAEATFARAQLVVEFESTISLEEKISRRVEWYPRWMQVLLKDKGAGHTHGISGETWRGRIGELRAHFDKQLHQKLSSLRYDMAARLNSFETILETKVDSMFQGQRVENVIDSAHNEFVAGSRSTPVETPSKAVGKGLDDSPRRRETSQVQLTLEESLERMISQTEERLNDKVDSMEDRIVAKILAAIHTERK